MWEECVCTKSTPMVEMYDSVYVSSANRRRRQDLPTPLSPIRRSLHRQSQRHILDNEDCGRQMRAGDGQGITT